MSDFISVAKVGDVPDGEGRIYEVGNVAVAVFNSGGSFYAVDNMCIHRGGPLGDGLCAADTVTCPWHGWQFDLATGACRSSPGESIATYQVRVEDDRILVRV